MSNKILVAHESQFGNTKKVAELIAESLKMHGQVQCQHVEQVAPAKLQEYQLIIVGCPTQGFSMTPKTKAFLDEIPAGGLSGVQVLAFDTRMSPRDVKVWIVRQMMNWFGYAAEKIAKKLKQKGGKLLAPAEGFLVADKEGPLKDGEMERGQQWAVEVLRKKAE